MKRCMINCYAKTNPDRKDANARSKKVEQLSEAKMKVVNIWQMASERENDMGLTKSESNNQILSKHMRQLSQSSNHNKSASDITLRVKQLTEIVHYAPILKLKVREILLVLYLNYIGYQLEHAAEGAYDYNKRSRCRKCVQE